MMRRVIRSLLLLPIAAVSVGCGPPVQQVAFNISHIKPGYCEAIIAQPGHFWDAPQRVMPCRTDDGRMIFIQQSAASADFLSELTGPLSTVTSHMMIPITPIP